MDLSVRMGRSRRGKWAKGQKGKRAKGQKGQGGGAYRPPRTSLRSTEYMYAASSGWGRRLSSGQKAASPPM
ncbi:hypothetical protein NOR_03902 [Metarhizium rileyi]|uniref:Uncharacterized protein n=1 Tax=Metarhizium rileyi (strain RCEF 4871) TaxID=1649241 RepID=A0A167EMU7_METRR|nr:hypothetical protein NOR_03902 [Metarhizium rileyi RCEF 4871]